MHEPTWERVTIDRAAKTITGEILSKNNDNTLFATGKSTMSSVGDSNDKSHYRVELWDVAGNGTGKVEAFKTQCLKLAKAVQFQSWTQ
jgi:hypothetical protein